MGVWPFAIWGAFVCHGANAEGNSSLSESNIESATIKVTASALLSKEDELRRQLSLERESVKTLTESLAESNAEAELFRRKYSDLRLRVEALGLESADKDRAKLEQRLLNAVSDLQLFREKCAQYHDQMLRLMETVLHFLKTAQSGDAQARMEVEAQLRAINELLGQPADVRAAEPTLMDGSVISVKEEWSLVVGNLGEQQGVKMGMPLRVVRGDRLIATLRVVDVRQKICGAVIQEMGSEKEKIKVGDRLQVDARQNMTLK
jgi:hypothetical protein